VSGARLAVIAAALLAAPAPAAAQPDDRPSTGKLVAVGTLTAVPTYWGGVLMHEGMHALVAKACGADILEFGVLPGRYGPQRHFYFGYVRYRGTLSRGQQTLFLLAPKLNDLVWLGGYAALVGFGGTPDNHYGQVVLIRSPPASDRLRHDLLQFWHPADVDVALARNGAHTFLQRLPGGCCTSGSLRPGSRAGRGLARRVRASHRIHSADGPGGRRALLVARRLH
jgi:hypothetical protein